MSDKLPPSVAVIDQDEIKRTSTCNNIERYGFTVYRSNGMDNILSVISLNKPNIVIISSRMEGGTALEMATKIRQLENCNNMPFIFIIEESESPSNYKAIDNGLAEFIKRNFTPNELMTTIKSLLRRARPVFQDKVIKYKDLKMDLATFKVFRSSKQVHLGPTEFKILQLMVNSPKKIFSRQQIMDYVWGVGYNIEPRTVDVHVNRIRTLIKVANDDMPFIKTVRAAGYCLSLPGEID